MGWADCGTDDLGRPIGYSYEATCDHAGCNASIHRGLSFVCGDMHGEDETSCARYFCGDHVVHGANGRRCLGCYCQTCDDFGQVVVDGLPIPRLRPCPDCNADGVPIDPKRAIETLRSAPLVRSA